ncbi:hypothetical protein [Actinacidiphila sp. bgisy160]|uniref:hypothetical protein n=1 Tax=Actinacidiphila sp. bgisy160 TaxID=3413796 RepID=UPI003D73570B
MNKRARDARAALRRRSADTRFEASLLRGRALATHFLAAGVDDVKAIKGAASGLSAAAKRIGIAPVRHGRTLRTVDGHRFRKWSPVGHYSRAQLPALVNAYNPRKPEYRAALDALRYSLAA